MAEPEYVIDVASFNPVNDWGKVRRNGIVAASVKISQATNYLNPLRESQVRGGRAAGVRTGGYHFGDPRVNARAQADYFVANAKNAGAIDAGCLPPMYDAENWDGNFRWTSRAQLTEHINAWLDELADSTDVEEAFVYGSLSWWTSGMLTPADWAGRGIKVLNWVAVYNGRPGDLQGWSHPDDALHQYTSDGVVDGISVRVDKNVTLRGRSLTSGGVDSDQEGFLVGLEQWKQDRLFERIMSASAGVEGQNFDGPQFAAEQAWRDAMTSKVDAIGAATAQLAEADRGVTLDPGQLEALTERIETTVQREVDELESQVRARLDLMATALAERLGADRPTVLSALEEFYGRAVPKDSEPEPPSGG
jgi:GH25 family lysozyme M1 (1,4-beta-N-acetylmuramidase)